MSLGVNSSGIHSMELKDVFDEVAGMVCPRCLANPFNGIESQRPGSAAHSDSAAESIQWN